MVLKLRLATYHHGQIRLSESSTSRMGGLGAAFAGEFSGAPYLFAFLSTGDWSEGSMQYDAV
jgi:hypothetical protein